MHLPFVQHCASHLYGNTFEEVLGVGLSRKFPDFCSDHTVSIFVLSGKVNENTVSTGAGNTKTHQDIPKQWTRKGVIRVRLMFDAWFPHRGHKPRVNPRNETDKSRAVNPSAILRTNPLVIFSVPLMFTKSFVRMDFSFEPPPPPLRRVPAFGIFLFALLHDFGPLCVVAGADMLGQALREPVVFPEL